MAIQVRQLEDQETGQARMAGFYRMLAGVMSAGIRGAVSTS
jgi:hypothetical protein